MAKKPTPKSSTKKSAPMPAAPAPLTVTPPSTKAGGPTPPPPPDFSIGPLAVTPPSTPKRLLSQEFVTASEKVREKVHRKQSSGTTGLPPKTPTAADGLPEYAGCESMKRWSADVRVLLTVTEIVSQLVFEPGQTNEVAAVLVRKSGAAGTAAVLKITRPKGTHVFDTKEKSGGIGDVANWANVKKKRLSDADVLVSADKSLGSLFMSSLGLDELQAPITAQLIRAVIEVTAVSVHWLKDHFVVPRPYELTGLGKAIDPVLEHPGHGSYPGGHAAQAAAVAYVLDLIAKDRFDAKTGSGLQDVAELVADSRLIAGLHYPIDNRAGSEVGKVIGKFLERIANAAPASPVEWESLTIAQDQTATRKSEKESISDFPKLKCLWTEAKKELDGLV